MFFGVFIAAAGILSLLEAMGLIADVKWGMPLAVTLFGVYLTFVKLSKRRKNVQLRVTTSSN